MVDVAPSYTAEVEEGRVWLVTGRKEERIEEEGGEGKGVSYRVLGSAL